jgi:methyl-accepting chemotaxis protein
MRSGTGYPASTGSATGRTRIRSKLLSGLLALFLLLAATTAILHKQQLLMQDSCKVLQRVHTIERFLLECRRQEKNLLLRRQALYIDLFSTNMDSVRQNTSELMNQVSDPSISSDIESLMVNEEAYARYFLDAVENLRTPFDRAEHDRLVDLTVERARACHSLIGRIRSVVMLRLNATNEMTRLVSQLSVVVAFLLALLIAVLLTRSIVKPLEYLRSLAEEVSMGDIQDMDVEFAGLDMDRFTSRESFDLAQSFRRMVTSIRMLVPTERGLMDNYHMTIVVLVNRALGPAGWSIIEKARAGAGFGSFAEVGPSKIEQFIDSLKEETATLTSEREFTLLAEAIRNLPV